MQAPSWMQQVQTKTVLDTMTNLMHFVWILSDLCAFCPCHHNYAVMTHISLSIILPFPLKKKKLRFFQTWYRYSLSTKNLMLLFSCCWYCFRITGVSIFLKQSCKDIEWCVPSLLVCYMPCVCIENIRSCWNAYTVIEQKHLFYNSFMGISKLILTASLKFTLGQQISKKGKSKKWMSVRKYNTRMS